MPVQFLDSSGSGTDTAAAEAIEYAVNHGAKVINASWGGSGTDPTIAAAIQYADQNGVIIVAAAGNNGTDDDNSSTWFSPASYSVDYPNLITVAATDSNGTLASWSNYGVASVQLAAPGVNVYGVGDNGTYGDRQRHLDGRAPGDRHDRAGGGRPPDLVDEPGHRRGPRHHHPRPHLAGKVTTGGIVNAAAAVANTDGPYVVSATPDGSINSSSGLSSVQLNFNEEINPATFTAVAGHSHRPRRHDQRGDRHAGLRLQRPRVHHLVPHPDAAGTYTLKVGPDIQDWYGNDMNQNRNGVNGEASDAFVETIRQTAPGSTDLLSVTGIPTSVTAGTSETFTVTALSPNGGTDTGYLGTIEFSSTDPQAVLPASYTFTAADDGHPYVHRDVQDRRHRRRSRRPMTAKRPSSAPRKHHRPGRRRRVAESHRLPDHRHRRHAGDIHRHRLRCLR